MAENKKIKWMMNDGNLYYIGNPPVHVEGISVDKSSLSFTDYGQTAKINATITPEDTDFKKIIWESSDNYVASVDNEGNVTSGDPGEATITVTTKDRGCKKTISVSNTRAYQVNYLAVGGGGGGKGKNSISGSNDTLVLGGGGGGGAVICGSVGLDLDTEYTIVVGAGGAGGCCCGYTSADLSYGCNGGDTCIGNIIIACGGKGGTECGGYSGNLKQGGMCCKLNRIVAGGGGGGAGGAGCKAMNECCGGNGGLGLYGYGGGGGGGSDCRDGGGCGCDGGGDGGSNCNARNYGGGGGGYGFPGSGKGGAGCQGVVQICYKTDGSCGFDKATGGVISTVGDYTVHTFQSNGTFAIDNSYYYTPNACTLLYLPFGTCNEKDVSGNHTMGKSCASWAGKTLVSGMGYGEFDKYCTVYNTDGTFTLPTCYTISVWTMRRTGSGYFGGMRVGYNNSGAQGLHMIESSDGTSVWFRMQNAIACACDTTTEAFKWRNITFTYNGNTGKIYLNGKLCQESYMTYAHGTNVVTIGEAACSGSSTSMTTLGSTQSAVIFENGIWTDDKISEYYRCSRKMYL